MSLLSIDFGTSYCAAAYLNAAAQPIPICFGVIIYNSFFYDLIHSHAQTKLKGDVWGYIKALNSIHMEYIGTKTDYIYHGSSFAPSYTPVTRNLYKGVNNNGVIFKSLQINGQIYKNNSGNTYTNP